MRLEPVELTGGDSVYCINEAQLKRAREMLSDEGGAAVKAELERLSGALTRNERAALAFLLIDSLTKSP